VGSVAATIAAAPEEHAGRTYRLTGPALISYADVAAVLSGVLGRPVAYRPVSFEEDRAAMIRAGVPAAVAGMNAQAFSLIAEGDAAWLSEDIPTLLGRPARSYAQFAADYAAAFA
jgi:uncharacterized protein YbjT (DUF2867 family)